MSIGVSKTQKPSNAEKRVLSLYGYTDYRTYLKDYYELRKKSHRGYSYRMFSKAAGFSSPNILKLVIEGQRNLSSDSIESFIKALSLSGPMSEYFRNLVKMNQAKSDDEKAQYYDQLIKLTPNAKRRELNPDSVEYLSHWIYPVLREMMQIEGFREDPYWVARRLTGQASAEEVSQAMRFLIDHGFIEKLGGGKFKALDNMILSSDEIRSLAVRRYHKGMLDRAKDAVEEIAMEERELGALTFLLPEESILELKSKLKHFRSELHQWAIQQSEVQSPDSVIQVNFQMFPQTRRNEG